jgi:nucleoside 2-deoxyribosyltransferase
MALLNNKIYLAGGAKDPKFANEWRKEAHNLLYPMFETLNPFRGREVKEDNTWVPYDANDIVSRDLHDILHADLVLAEMMMPDHNYVGTSMEIRTAADSGIPVVLWSDKFHHHYWLQYHSVKCCPTLKECCEYIKRIWGA